MYIRLGMLATFFSQSTVQTSPAISHQMPFFKNFVAVLASFTLIGAVNAFNGDGKVYPLCSTLNPADYFVQQLGSTQACVHLLASSYV